MGYFRNQKHGGYSCVGQENVAEGPGMADPGAQVDRVAFLSVEASDQLIWVATLPLRLKVAASLFGSHLENFKLIFEISTQALLHDFLEAFWLNYYRRRWLVFWLLIFGRKAFGARRGALRAI